MLLNSKKKSTFVVLNEKGLHARPATELVKCASQFKSSITLHYKGYSVDAKSLLGILMMAATKGAKILIDAEGEDAAQCTESLIHLAKNKFYMNY